MKKSQPPVREETEEEEVTIGKIPTIHPAIDKTGTDTGVRTSTSIPAGELSGIDVNLTSLAATLKVASSSRLALPELLLTSQHGERKATVTFLPNDDESLSFVMLRLYLVLNQKCSFSLMPVKEKEPETP